MEEWEGDNLSLLEAGICFLDVSNESLEAYIHPQLGDGRYHVDVWELEEHSLIVVVSYGLLENHSHFLEVPYALLVDDIPLEVEHSSLLG